MGQHLPLVSRDEQQRCHARRHAQADGADGAAHRLHDVIEGKAGLHLAAGAVDIERHGCVGVATLQVEQAADDGGTRLRVHGGRELELAVGEHLVSNVEAVQALRGLADDLRLVDGYAFAHNELLPEDWHASVAAMDGRDAQRLSVCGCSWKSGLGNYAGKSPPRRTGAGLPGDGLMALG